MINKKLMLVATIMVMLNLQLAHAADEKFADKIIDMPNGDLRFVVAVAAKEGHATGRLSGKAAKMVEQKYGPGHVVMVKAVRMREMIGKCYRVIATYYEVNGPKSSEIEVPVKVCPK